MTFRVLNAWPTLYCAHCGAAMFCLTPHEVKEPRLFRCLQPVCERNREVLQVEPQRWVAKVVEDPGIDPLTTGSN